MDEGVAVFDDNRRSFEEAVNEIHRLDSLAGVAVGSVDLNGLKATNDNICHAAGDELIRAAASVLSETFRNVAKVYRTGGDEFYVLSTSSVTPENLAALTDRLDEAAAAWRGKMVENLSLSYGFAFGREEPETTVEQLLILADKRMYVSKRRYYDSQELDRRGSY